MKLGVAYYPEYSDREDWKIHLEKIRDSGIKNQNGRIFMVTITAR